MVAMNQRYRADARALRSFVASGELGDVYYLKAGWLTRAKPVARSWRERRAAGGGALMELGIQMLDLALWILGYPRPLRVSAHVHRAAGSEVEDAAALLLRLEGDRLVNLEVTWSLLAKKERQFMHLLGSAGSGTLSPLAVFREMPRGLVDVTPKLPPQGENLFTASYRAELQHFIEVVRGDREPDEAAQHVALMRVMEAAYRSAEEGREVELTEEKG
jgi:predicted dehydrogenase